MFKLFIKVSYLTLLCLTLGSTAFAATQGTLGETSTGSSDLSIEIPEFVRISDVGDLAFGSYGGSGDVNGNDDLCIYRNNPAATYFVTASGDGAASAFSMTDGTNTIAYNVYFNDASGTTGEALLTTNSKSTQQSGANTSALDCGGSNNANFHVEILEANLMSAAAGSYNGTLTMVAEPN